MKDLYKFYYTTYGKSKHNIHFHTRHTNSPERTLEAKQLTKLFNVKAIAGYGWTKLKPLS